jgi:hypothetical protein
VPNAVAAAKNATRASVGRRLILKLHAELGSDVFDATVNSIRDMLHFIREREENGREVLDEAFARFEKDCLSEDEES